jgi:hypothetical protein
VVEATGVGNLHSSVHRVFLWLIPLGAPQKAETHVFLTLLSIEINVGDFL